MPVKPSRVPIVQHIAKSYLADTVVAAPWFVAGAFYFVNLLGNNTAIKFRETLHRPCIKGLKEHYQNQARSRGGTQVVNWKLGAKVVNAKATGQVYMKLVWTQWFELPSKIWALKSYIQKLRSTPSFS